MHWYGIENFITQDSFTYLIFPGANSIKPCDFRSIHKWDLIVHPLVVRSQVWKIFSYKNKIAIEAFLFKFLNYYCLLVKNKIILVLGNHFLRRSFPMKLSFLQHYFLLARIWNNLFVVLEGRGGEDMVWWSHSLWVQSKEPEKTRAWTGSWVVQRLHGAAGWWKIASFTQNPNMPTVLAS